jgi:hypothetical protein
VHGDDESVTDPTLSHRDPLSHLMWNSRGPLRVDTPSFTPDRGRGP